MKAVLSRSAVVASVLLAALIVFSATPSIAETLLFQLQSPKESRQSSADALGKFQAEEPATAIAAATRSRTVEEARALLPAASYVATAYSLKGRTASGRMVSRGLIAADPSVLPLGSRVRLEHPGYCGEYLVADTGGQIRGRRIDIWTPSAGEAMRFGRRTVKLTVLSYGGRRTRRTART
jgi:3D (Asp-Asp-Asp) domain-containing protein